MSDDKIGRTGLPTVQEMVGVYDKRDVATTAGVSNGWDPKAWFVQTLASGNTYDTISEESVTPDTMLIMAGPPTISKDTGAKFAPVGLINTVSMSSDNQLQPHWEMGSNHTKFTRGKALNNMQIGAMLANKESLMNLLTRYSPTDRDGAYPDEHDGPIWMNLESEAASSPFGLLIVFKMKAGADASKEDSDTNVGNTTGSVLTSVYLENCHLASYNTSASSNEAFLQENVSIMFDRMIPATYTKSDSVSAGPIAQKTRLYTVRPRNTFSITEKTGNVSSIKFHLPTQDKNSVDKWVDSVDDSIKETFRSAVTSNDDTGQDGFINFIAKNVSYDIQEKSQTLHTFGGGEAVYFFGRAPVVVTFSGLLVDDIDNDQFVKFMQLYMQFLRGSRASKDMCFTELKLPNASFVGAFLGMQVQQGSDRDTDVTFSAQFQADTFTLASATASVLGANKIPIDNKVTFVRGPDPSRTIEQIYTAINQSRRLSEGVRQSIVDKLWSKATNQGTDDDYLEMREQYDYSTESLTYSEYTQSFGTLPVLESLQSAADWIDGFFDGLDEALSVVTDAITDVADFIDDTTQALIGIVESIEQGVDQIVSNLESVVDAIYGISDTFDELESMICNFPESMADKYARLMNTKGGGVSLAIAGSDSIDRSEAVASSSTNIPVGSIRGTSVGDAALLTISTSEGTTTDEENLTLGSTDSSDSTSLLIDYRVQDIEWTGEVVSEVESTAETEISPQLLSKSDDGVVKVGG